MNDRMLILAVGSKVGFCVVWKKGNGISFEGKIYLILEKKTNKKEAPI